ncbi:cobalamin biosynthesis protein [Thiorhodospira sibirica]|uniref:cobalamin biosynthesis protein n=1 Tax=Thiorhodospira sibirica TaxID=154347 RepID=UPI00022C4C70|nr:cobalamin biosynthesis protein [Thiorhodospira sibirica]
MKYVIGIGCDRNTSVQTVKEALHHVLQQVNIEIHEIVALATIEKKSEEPAILQLAHDLQCPLHIFDAPILAKVSVPNPSSTVQRYMATPAVAEAAALLGAQTTMENLILEKYKYRGKDAKHVTLAIACQDMNCANG